MTWDYTYNDNNGYTDSLAVVYRTGSSPNWQTIWIRGGADLEVLGTQTWFWDAATPSISWGPGYLNLDFLAGEPCVEFAFDNRGYYGNHVWIDNVNLNGTFDDSGLEEINLNVHVFPNPSNGSFTITASESVDSYSVLDLTGRVVIEDQKLNSKHFSIDLSDETSGMYVLELRTNSGSRVTRLMKE